MWGLWGFGAALILLGRIDVVDNQTAWLGFWIAAAVAVTTWAFPSLTHSPREFEGEYSVEEIQSFIRDITREISDSSDPPGRLFLDRAAWNMEVEQFEAAFSDLTEALRRDSELEYEIRLRRGVILYQTQRPSAAINELDSLVESDGDPSSNSLKLSALIHRGYSHYTLGNIEAAVADLTDPLTSEIRDANFLCIRGEAKMFAGDLQGAVDDLETALRIKPGLARAWFGIAVLRACSNNDSFRNGSDAVRAATEACRLARDDEWYAFNGLAAAYAESGDFDAAMSATRKAIELLPAEDALLADIMERRIELFGRREPVRLHDKLHVESNRIARQKVIDIENAVSTN